MALGHNERDWTAWYRLFNRGRFPYEAARDCQVLRNYAEADLVDVAGDSIRKLPFFRYNGQLGFTRSSY